MENLNWNTSTGAHCGAFLAGKARGCWGLEFIVDLALIVYWLSVPYYFRKT
jgi:hypothetical protein